MDDVLITPSPISELPTPMLTSAAGILASANVKVTLTPVSVVFPESVLTANPAVSSSVLTRLMSAGSSSL